MIDPAWASLTDDDLEPRLRHYYWLNKAAPNIYRESFDSVVGEAHRRGKPNLVENAKKWVEKYGAPAPLL